MTLIKILSTSIIMCLTVPVIAQKKNSVSMQWKIAAHLPADSGKTFATGFAGPVTGMHHNIFFIAGGANFPDGMPWRGGKKKYYNKIYAYADKQHQLVPLKKSFILPYNVAYAACCSTTDGVFYAGGENENGISNKAWLIQWDAVAQNILIKNLPDLPVAVTNAAATIVGHTVYIAGGETTTEASSQFVALDLNNIDKGWMQLVTLPQPVSHTVLIATAQKNTAVIYLAGGRKKNTNGVSDLYADLFVYNIATNNWERKTALPYALCAGTGGISTHGDLLIFGGDKGTVFHQVEILLAAIGNEKDAIKQQQLVIQKNKLQSEHPGFSKEVLQYNLNNNTWKKVGTIPFATPVTTTAVQNKNIIYIPSGEIKAGVRSPDILSVTILPKAK
jgi:cyclically-permuted mutarotase family protein